MSHKAVIVNTGGGYDNVTIVDRKTTDPSNFEVQIRIHANSLNYHDFAVVSGMWGPTEERIPMADGAGEVIKVGSKVKDFSPGDHVVSTFFPTWIEGQPEVNGFETVPGDGVDGFAQEYVTRAETSFTLAPKNWSHIESSTLTTAGLTAWRALFCDDHIEAKDTILIQGTGGVSIFALQFAKMVGATVVATSSSDEKIKKLKSLGADYTINYRKNSQWSEEVLEFTHGKGVDHVVEVGGPQTLEQSIMACKIGGHISLIGILTGLEGPFNFINALIKQVTVQGLIVGSRNQQIDMVAKINQSQMKPIVDKVFPLNKIVEAFKYQESNQHFGKICLEI